MTLGRTSSGAIKVKTDGTTRAVNCACCGGCSYPPLCVNGYPSNEWVGEGESVDLSGNEYFVCSVGFLGVPNCEEAPPALTNGFGEYLCGVGIKWVLLVGGGCLGSEATNYFCKSDGIDSPIGTYSGINYGDPNGGILSFTVTEKQGETC